MKSVIKLDLRFIFIDESSFSSRHLKVRTWLNKKNPKPVIKPYETSSIAMISALSDEGWLFSQLRKGTNWEAEMLEFLILLDQRMAKYYGWSFRAKRSKIIILMDNASIHKTKKIEEFFSKFDYLSISLPQYTPEWNPIERVFGILKSRISAKSLNKE